MTRPPVPAAPSYPWRAAWPLPAEGGDGNHWVTGACWLYCRRQGVRVLWIGPVRAPGADADVYGCGQCIAELAAMAREQAGGRDVVAGAAVRTTPAAASQSEPGRPTSRGAGTLLSPGRWAPSSTAVASTAPGSPGVASVQTSRTCRHCTTQTISGKTHCAVCKAQLYL